MQAADARHRRGGAIGRAAGGVVHVGISQDAHREAGAELPREMLLLALFLVAGSVAVAAVFVQDRLSRPLRELTDVAAHIVESGDLTRPIHVTSAGRGGAAGQRSFSQMVEKLREVTHQPAAGGRRAQAVHRAPEPARPASRRRRSPARRPRCRRRR